MPQSFHNSPTQVGSSSAFIETGTLANVNVRTMTVDWVSQYSGKVILDLPIMSPYFHYAAGEGCTCVPEPGARCLVCWPSDEKIPFVLGFLGAPEVEGGQPSADLTQATEDPGVESEEDLPDQKILSPGGSTAADNTSDASYRAGRPLLNPGDQMWTGRDGNFVVLRRGGVLQIGSTAISQRLYIPLQNYIKDFCENYELLTASGTLHWMVHRVENDPSGNAPTELVLLAREFAQDKQASIKVRIGALDTDKTSLDGKPYLEVVVAPQQINPDDGKVSGNPVYIMRVDKVGSTYQLQAKNRTFDIQGNDTLTVRGNQGHTIYGNRTDEVRGAASYKIGGAHKMDGTSSQEHWTGQKVIDALTTLIGGADASEPAVLGLRLITWLASHTHPSPYSPPVQAGAVSGLVSRKVFVK
jgi:hypothetical protein